MSEKLTPFHEAIAKAGAPILGADRSPTSRADGKPSIAVREAEAYRAGAKDVTKRYILAGLLPRRVERLVPESSVAPEVLRGTEPPAEDPTPDPPTLDKGQLPAGAQAEEPETAEDVENQLEINPEG